MKSNQVVQELVTILKEDDQLPLLSEITSQLHRLVSEPDFKRHVTITTAIHLNEDEKKEIHKTLKQTFQKPIGKIINKTDKNIIGGIQIQIGDVVIDASVRGELNRIKNELLV